MTLIKIRRISIWYIVYCSSLWTKLFFREAKHWLWNYTLLNWIKTKLNKTTFLLICYVHCGVVIFLVKAFIWQFIAIIKHLFGSGIIEISLPHYPKLVNSNPSKVFSERIFLKSISNITWQTDRLMIINSPSDVYIFEKFKI